MMNPYENLPKEAFWKLAVANRNMFDIDNLWERKFEIKPTHKVATFGSCFAQHIGRALAKRGYNWFITEKAPEGLTAEDKIKFNYDVFSCRTGNIYTTSLLNQWVKWALNKEPIPDEFWVKESRYYDPFRPNIEKNGFDSKEEMINSRNETLKSFNRIIKESDIFVFTLGLTESWFNKKGSYEYPMCPGTIAGEFDFENHEFLNQQVGFVQKNLNEALNLIRDNNPKIKVILTVSPVPLTATNSGKHVLVSTMYSKSILRAVAGQLANNRSFIDYFPSYEIINSAPFKATFFNPNLRTVNQVGVNHVMKSFFKEDTAEESIKLTDTKLKEKQTNEDVVCEEELLAAFAKESKK